MGNGTSQPLCGSRRSPCHSQGDADRGGGPGPPPRASTEPCSCRPERTPVCHRQPCKSKDQQLPPTSSWRRCTHVLLETLHPPPREPPDPPLSPCPLYPEEPLSVAPDPRPGAQLGAGATPRAPPSSPASVLQGPPASLLLGPRGSSGTCAPRVLTLPSSTALQRCFLLPGPLMGHLQEAKSRGGPASPPRGCSAQPGSRKQVAPGDEEVHGGWSGWQDTQHSPGAVPRPKCCPRPLPCETTTTLAPAGVGEHPRGPCRLPLVGTQNGRTRPLKRELCPED